MAEKYSNVLKQNTYGSNQITKKVPKSDNRLSKFDWHDLSPIFFDPNASS